MNTADYERIAEFTKSIYKNMDVLSIGHDNEVHISEEALRKDFASFTVIPRDCLKYPFELQVIFNNVKFYCLSKGGI